MVLVLIFQLVFPCWFLYVFVVFVLGGFEKGHMLLGHWGSKSKSSRLAKVFTFPFANESFFQLFSEDNQ